MFSDTSAPRTPDIFSHIEKLRLLSSEDLDKGVETLEALRLNLEEFIARDEHSFKEEVEGDPGEGCRLDCGESEAQERKPCPGGLRGEVQEVLSSHAAAHGLAIDLASAGNKNSLNKSLELLLDAALKIEGIDGGVYTVSEESRVALLLHQGLSERFIESCSKYEPGAPRSSLVGAGEWIYWNRYGHKHSKGPDEHVLPFHLPGGHDRHQQVRRYGAGPGRYPNA